MNESRWDKYRRDGWDMEKHQNLEKQDLCRGHCNGFKHLSMPLDGAHLGNRFEFVDGRLFLYISDHFLSNPLMHKEIMSPPGYN